MTSQKEFTDHRWIPLTKASDAELRYFLWSMTEQTIRQNSRRRWFETPSCSLWRHCNAFVSRYCYMMIGLYGSFGEGFHICRRYAFLTRNIIWFIFHALYMAPLILYLIDIVLQMTEIPFDETKSASCYKSCTKFVKESAHSARSKSSAY